MYTVAYVYVKGGKGRKGDPLEKDILIIVAGLRSAFGFSPVLLILRCINCSHVRSNMKSTRPDPSDLIRYVGLGLPYRTSFGNG